MTRLLALWRALRASLWFVPGNLVLLGVALAIGLVEADVRIDDGAFARWPRLFGTGASGARSLLVAVASSMITVAGVAFSITLVALSLASSQYTSRVLRNFMSDKTNQTVLGVFVGIFAYCLVVLRTIRDGSGTEFVPSLAVLGGVVLAFVGIGFFVYFIHHIAMAIQASHILARIGAETVRSVDALFPEGVGSDAQSEAVPEARVQPTVETWLPVYSARTGYIQGFDAEALFKVARKTGSIIRMERKIGDFAIEGQPLVSIGGNQRPDAGSCDLLRAAFLINHQRTTDQDAAFGVRQIVDVALKALSPGVNDTTTAIMAIDYLTAILVRLSRRTIESPWRYDEGELRVITLGSTYADLVSGAFDQIRQNSGGNVAVLARLLDALQTLAGEVRTESRRGVLRAQAVATEEAIVRTVAAPMERQTLQAKGAQVRAYLDSRARAIAGSSS